MSTTSTKGRAQAQAAATLETKTGRVTRGYADSLGNTTHADVNIQGQTNALVKLANASGTRLRVGDVVTVNFPRGNPLAGQVQSFGGSDSAGVSAAAGVAAFSGTGTSVVPTDLSALPFLVVQDSPDLPGASRLVAGSGLALTAGTETLGGATYATLILSGSSASVPQVPAWAYEKVNDEEFAVDHGEADFVVFQATYAIPLLCPNGDLVDLNASGASRTTCWGQYGRYTTELTVLSARTIQIACTADNAAEVYLNGVKLGTAFGQSYGATQPGSLGNPYTVSLALTLGRNLLQVRYFNDNDGGGNNSGLTVQGVGGPLASLVDQQLAALPAAGGSAPGVPAVPSWLYERQSNPNLTDPATQMTLPAPQSGTTYVDLTPCAPDTTLALVTASGDLVDLNAAGASRTTVWGQKSRYTTELTVLAAKTIQVTATADNAARCYLNGTQVGADFGDAFTSSQLSNPVTLTLALVQGRNVLRFHYCNDNDGGGNNSGLTVQGVGGTLASLVDQQLAATPAPKRRFWTTFYPATPATADTAPNLSRVVRLPRGTGGAATVWKPTAATLRTETPNAGATTVQLYSSAGGNAAFGSGSAVLASPLSLSGGSAYEGVTTTFAGTLSSAGIASGSLLAAQFSALSGGNVSAEIEWQEV